MIVIDFHSWVYYGDYTFNKKCWPKPVEMTKNLMNMSDTRVLLSTYPYLDTRGTHTAEAVRRGFVAVDRQTGKQVRPVANSMCAKESPSSKSGSCYLFDPFLPEARDWMWSLHQHYYDSGIESFWLDDTEPGGGKTEGGGSSADGLSYACGPEAYCGAQWSNKWVSIFAEGVQRQGVEKPIQLNLES